MIKLYIHTDGGAKGNPGPAAIGVIIKNEKADIIKTISRRIGESTNNVAEYKAVIYALEYLKSLYSHQDQNNFNIFFYLDSSLVVNQINGCFKIKYNKLRNLLLQIRQLENEIGGSIYYQQIPREQNKEADLLVNQAFEQN